jgi:hypothetical protein
MDRFAINRGAAARSDTLAQPSTAPLQPTASVPDTGRRAIPGGETTTPLSRIPTAAGLDNLGESNAELADALVRFQRSL